MDGTAEERDFPTLPQFSHALKRGVLGAAGMLLTGLTMLLILRALMPREYWGAHAGAGVLNNVQNEYVKYLVVAFFGPLQETVIAQLLPLEILRKLKVQPALSCAVAGFLFGLGHFINGGLAHGLAAGAAGVLLAAIYIKSRQDGFICAFAAAFTAHALNNLTVLWLAQHFPALANF